ncbi:MAG: aminoacyl-tRNA hydrolase [Bdellovibrionales bacterium]|nr:aminoacyl-tRNA hydrolase [Bdellovibrionales bacterium]
MLLIAGLGNPSTEYNLTRHNLGFTAIDYFIEDNLKMPLKFQNKCKAHILKTNLNNKSIIFAKPQTYMNLSGESIKALINYYKIDIENILIIQDDLDLNLLSFKYQKDRGHAGHNGIKNIHEELNTSNYSRLKLGIGRPENPNVEISNFVLEKFSKKELPDLENFLKLINKSLVNFIKDGFSKTANKFNNGSVNLS